MGQSAELPFQYRVTKYDPALRNESGAYLRDEWTSHSDIGRAFAEGVLTAAEYQRVEDAYARSARDFLAEAGVEAIQITGLETARDRSPIQDGARIPLNEVDGILRRVLREEFWCRFESPRAFVHVGYDYTMYVGVDQPCLSAEETARRLGCSSRSSSRRTTDSEIRPCPPPSTKPKPFATAKC